MAYLPNKNSLLGKSSCFIGRKGANIFAMATLTSEGEEDKYSSGRLELYTGKGRRYDYFYSNCTPRRGIKSDK